MKKKIEWNDGVRSELKETLNKAHAKMQLWPEWKRNIRVTVFSTDSYIEKSMNEKGEK